MAPIWVRASQSGVTWSGNSKSVGTEGIGAVRHISAKCARYILDATP